MASLREQLLELNNPNPSFRDPEEDYESLTAAKLSTKDPEIESTGLNNQFGSIRNRVSSLLEQDKKYHGTKISRNDIIDEVISPEIDIPSDDDSASVSSHYESEGEDVPEEDNDNTDEDHNDRDIEMQKEGTDDNQGLESEDDDYDDDDGGAEKADLEQDDETDPVLEGLLARKVDEDVSKGDAVKSQLELWDKFMEIRIKMQKCLQLSNKHPQHDVIPEFKASSGVHLAKAQGDAKASLKSVLDNLLMLQDLLYAKNAETSGLLTGESAQKVKADSDEEIPSDTDEETEPKEDKESKMDHLDTSKKRKLNLQTTEYEKEISKRHCAFEEFRDRTIAKWDEKTKLSSGKLRSKTFAAFDRSVVAQMKQILSDKGRLVKRTQLKRSVYRVLGKPEKHEGVDEDEMDAVDAHLKDYDEEIFDDDDFYHQLIKELIERKSNLANSKDPVTMGRQWLELQRYRRKAKRKIDVKASKGRRVRYNVHSKLVNLMAPVNAGTMSDQARNDLFRSLFGQRESKPIR